MTEQQIKLFWEKVNKTDSCWLWTASIGWNGYGMFGRPTRRAHRVALELAGIVLQPGEMGLHKCNEPRCVRVHPEHVYVGTAVENALDAWQGGRYYQDPIVGEIRSRHSRSGFGGSFPGRGFSPESLEAISQASQGERNGEAKLTGKQVVEIRQRYEAGKVGRSRTSSVTFQMLADQYHVSYTQVKRIIHRHAWRHL